MRRSDSVDFALSRPTRVVTWSNMDGIAAGSPTSGHTVYAEADGSAYQSLGGDRRHGRSATHSARACASGYPGARSPTGSHPRAGPTRSNRSWSATRGGRLAGPGRGRAHDRLAVWLFARHRGGNGRGCRTPAIDGYHPVVCGDSRLGNFGFYASPERDLVIDLNDFDEAYPGAGSGTCVGWWPASGSPAGTTAHPRSSAARRRARVSPPTGRS